MMRLAVMPESTPDIKNLSLEIVIKIIDELEGFDYALPIPPDECSINHLPTVAIKTYHSHPFPKSICFEVFACF